MAAQSELRLFEMDGFDSDSSASQSSSLPAPTHDRVPRAASDDRSTADNASPRPTISGTEVNTPPRPHTEGTGSCNVESLLATSTPPSRFYTGARMSGGDSSAEDDTPPQQLANGTGSGLVGSIDEAVLFMANRPHRHASVDDTTSAPQGPPVERPMAYDTPAQSGHDQPESLLSGAVDDTDSVDEVGCLRGLCKRWFFCGGCSGN